ncbi:myb-like protein AA [Chrysoperla carnea]|uniref:myb-like protein AA n=1 Tax=Chrysoperla carnea TaxID=189513 RepID=UPI001D05D505|nr:myb-like protein AA [Chrysoperla carnea]XP_044727494.1 myb-like protein AA [Chrysoperla carnea]
MNLIVALGCLFFIVTHNVNTQEISEDISTTVVSSDSDFPSSPPTIINTPREPTTNNNQRSFESLLAQKILEHASKNDWTGKVHLRVARPTSTPDENNTSKPKATPVIDQQFVDQFTKIFNRQYRKQIGSNNQQKVRPYSKTIENQLYEEQIRTNNVKPTATGYNYPLFNQQQSQKTQKYYYPTVNEQQLLKTRENYYYQPSNLSKTQQLYYYYPIVDQVSTPKQFYYNYPTEKQTLASQQLYYYIYPTVDQVNRPPRQLYNNYATINQAPKPQQLYNYYPEQTTLQQLYYYPQQQSAQQVYYYPQQQYPQQMYYYYPQTTQQQLYYYPQTNSQQLYSQLNQQSNVPNYPASNQMYMYNMPETHQLNNDQMTMSYPVQNMNKDQLVYYFPTKNIDFGNSDTNKLYDESTMMEKTKNFEDQQILQQLDQQTYINMQKLNQQQPQTPASNQLYYYYLI